jgi:hypothetical protein
MALSGSERVKRCRAKRKAEDEALKAERADPPAAHVVDAEFLIGTLLLKKENAALRERVARLTLANRRLKSEVEDLNELFMNEAEEAEALRHQILEMSPPAPKLKKSPPTMKSTSISDAKIAEFLAGLDDL